MKKKIAIIALSCLLVVMLCASLVACDKDDGENASGYRFSKDMSKEDIIAKVKTLDSASIVYHFVEHQDENDIIEYDMIYEFGRTFMIYRIVYQGVDNTLVMDFFENGRHYDYSHYYYEESTESDEFEIVDFIGLDVSFEYIDDAYDAMVGFFDEYDNYKIDNGNLVFEEKGDEYDETITIKNCNSTVLDIPQAIADYQTKLADNKIVEYVLSDTQDYYSMDMRYVFGVHINSYEVPETYNDLPVKEVDVSSVMNGGTLTLPNTIEKLNTSGGSDEPLLNIVYKGTKEQWISKGLGVYAYNTAVTCSDGKIESATPEE